MLLEGGCSRRAQPAARRRRRRRLPNHASCAHQARGWCGSATIKRSTRLTAMASRNTAWPPRAARKSSGGEQAAVVASAAGRATNTSAAVEAGATATDCDTTTGTEAATGATATTGTTAGMLASVGPGQRRKRLGAATTGRDGALALGGGNRAHTRNHGRGAEGEGGRYDGEARAGGKRRKPSEQRPCASERSGACSLHYACKSTFGTIQVRGGARKTNAGGALFLKGSPR